MVNKCIDQLHKGVNMKKGFTMIELIFVIVILGILAAVALPRLAGTANDARIETMNSFIGTLNRSVAPTMWSKAIRDGNGSVKLLNLKDYTDIPKGIKFVNDGNLTGCVAFGAAAGKVADINTSSLPSDEVLYCMDGNSTSAPKFGFKMINSNTDVNTTMQKNK